ncbi:MAG: DUF3307 domain-containing protein [Candidatus Omnitrophica bacterium]|nr:DUF3307 domain-containing protein [Candidatus Omnitrophota bacterium]
MISVYYIVILHFFSDFFTQWDKTGLFYQKTKTLLSHSFSYTVYIFIGSLILFGFNENFSLYFSLYNGIAHLIIDSIINYLGSIKKKKKYWNYMLIGVDQMIHLLILFQSFYYFNKI